MARVSVGDRWVCAHCGTHSVIGKDNLSQTHVQVNSHSKHQYMVVFLQSISCANGDCGELSLELEYGPGTRHVSGNYGLRYLLDEGDARLTKSILPEARLALVPDDVPGEIATTYREAVLISDISGRAAAAMARRCLQGIVRDFFEIPTNKRGNLGAELSFVKAHIDEDLWDAIQAVRAVGDIGAHMDNNVNYIIDISPKEALLLIGLIETLFKEWYLARAKRRQATTALRDLVDGKRGEQKKAKAMKAGAVDEDEDVAPIGGLGGLPQ